MDWDVCRQEFREYHAALAAARYAAHAGRPLAQPVHAIYERYSELFRRETIDGLDTEAFYTATERESAARLRDALRLEYVGAQTRAVKYELAHYEAATHLLWQTQRVGSDNFPTILAQTTQASARRDLTARWAERVRGGDDLRAEIRLQQRQAAQDLGFDGYNELFAAVTGVILANVARAANGFLQQTESLYRAALANLAPRLWPDADLEQLNEGDWLGWYHQPQPHPCFPAHDLLPTYHDFLRGLGWRAGQQNLHIDNLERPGKKSETACFATRPPAEVFISLTSHGGVSAYRDFFAAVGRAQHYAHTSNDLATRHPAFVYASDGAINEGYAALFRGFFYDAAWLREHRAGLGPETARNLARDEAWRTLAETRRLCALMLWEMQIEAHADPREENLAASYSASLTEATGFQHDAAFALAATMQPLAGVARWRASLLAAALGDYLRIRYGRRWWAARRAGDDLADWWNTGSRYSTEVLAQAVGAGEPSFELLTETLREVLQSKP